MNIKCKSCGCEYSCKQGDINAELVSCPMCAIEEIDEEPEKPKPIEIDPAIAKELRKPHPISEARKAVPKVKTPKRKRRTKAEMIADGEQTKEPSVLRKSHLFDEELKEFIKENWTEMTDRVLAEEIEERFGKTRTPQQIRDFRRTKGFKVVGTGHGKRKMKVEDEEGEGDDMFLGDDYEEEEEPKKDPKEISINGEPVPRKVMDYIESRLDVEELALRDEIIELFEINYRLAEIKSMKSQFRR